MKFIMIPMILASIKCFITSDSGESDYFNHNYGFSCTNSGTTTSVTTFVGTFENPPQVLIAVSTTTIYMTAGAFFQIDIIQVTTENFQIKILCSGVIRFKYKWYAVNDNRIQILHLTKQTNLVDGSFNIKKLSNYIFTHSHNLLKAKKAIAIIDCLKHSDRPLNFYLEVYQVTSTIVQIKLNNFTSKLLELGYSIVLGTEEGFQIGNLIFTSGTSYSGSTPQLNLSFLFLPIVGFYWDYNQDIRMASGQQLSLFNYNYQISTYSTSYMHSIRCQEVQFFEQILFPMYIYSYRVTKKYERYISNAVKVQILELNQQFVSFGDYNVQIPVEMNKITIQIELKFMPNERLVGQFLKCNECGSKNVYKIDQNYLCANNFIRYRLLLRQYSINTQDLIISIGLSTVNIKQIINQVVTDYDIVQLQFINLQL